MWLNDCTNDWLIDEWVSGWVSGLTIWLTDLLNDCRDCCQCVAGYAMHMLTPLLLGGWIFYREFACFSTTRTRFEPTNLLCTCFRFGQISQYYICFPEILGVCIWAQYNLTCVFSKFEDLFWEVFRNFKLIIAIQSSIAQSVALDKKPSSQLH